jgi:hypothetical protein
MAADWCADEAFFPHAECHILANPQHLNLPSSCEAALLISQWLNNTYNK